MSKPVLAGLFSRALLASALASAGVAWLANPNAFADEEQIFPCGPYDRVKQFADDNGRSFITLSPEQFNFARGMFVMAPETPATLPPGDRAALSSNQDGTASIVFLDGDQACAPMKLGKEGVDILMQVGRGEITHSGRSN